jgi:nicotinate-nucleotide adenylyltransferase
MKRIGFYAGSFDPIHDGHISFAKEAAKNYKLEKVFFMVEPRPRRKQGVKALEHRQEMVRIALANEGMLGAVIVDQRRFSVTTTLPHLQARFDGAHLHMLMGDDVVMRLADWPDIDELIRNVCFVIGLRTKAQKDVQDTILKLQKTRNISIDFRIFHAGDSEYSSRNIRKQIKQGVKPAGVQEAVYKYICSENLYKISGSTS